ncbi:MULTISPECIES: hypothetical protein [Paenibacillus]|uniref:hypothetical protein n=1 Tax=Paenibacillus TaxID=44249 RepID=UPI0022B90B1E|nr:hypothetical protein [Paenibacillus caseinilyticus]MCZ8523325.1 hypothetical protein [Paenibacillus caseinilyticus]
MNCLYKRIGILSVILFTSCVIVASADGIAPGAEPGSVDDPIITKSYFDQNIANKVTDELTKQSITEAKVKELIAAAITGDSPITPTPETGSPAASSSLKVVQLQPGQTLLGSAGTEIIVRSGKVLAVSDTEDGIPNVTSGKDISAGSPVELNHMLIIPREGRGIKPDPKSKADIYVMVRGGYTLMDADRKATP